MEEEIRMDETEQADQAEQGDAANNEAETSVHISNISQVKRGRGRPQGSKKLKVCVTDVNLTELVSGISNGGSTQPPRGRGRPKLIKHTEQQGSGDNDADNSVQAPRGRGRPKGSKKQTSDGNSATTDHTPKKRGRPRKSPSVSTVEKSDGEGLTNGGSDTPKVGRGRPKGSTKRKLTSEEENEGSSVTPRKRGRPKGSLNKKTKLERQVTIKREANGSLNSVKRGRGRPRKVRVDSDSSNGISTVPKRGRGRPRKQEQVTNASNKYKRRGRPKGSLNKNRLSCKALVSIGRSRKTAIPSTMRRPGRPRKLPAKRGRPRKYPLLSNAERNKPKVWKPLGRPRKYPRVDPPEGAPPGPRRGRGRPRKSETKRGAHLRKSGASSPSSPRSPSEGSPKKRGFPPSTPKSESDTPRKRGRPKGSGNKNKGKIEAELDSVLSNHSEIDTSAVGVECKGEPVEEEQQTDMLPIEQDTEETIQDASLEVSNQA